MVAQTLLEKFEMVEITNGSRISEEELDFCTRQQMLYEQVLEHYRSTFYVIQKTVNDDAAFLKTVSDVNDYSSHGRTYHYYSGYKIDADKKDFAQKDIGSTHERFISILIEYFNNRYGTTIEKPAYETLFEINQPEYKSTFYGFHGITEAEKDVRLVQSRAQQMEYEQAMDEYLDYIIHANLDYNAVLDHIFVSLNGSTFTERAEAEIIENSRIASGRCGKPNYEIKNKKIVLSILHPRKSWNNQYEVDLSGSGYRSILRALTYFDSDKRVVGTFAGWMRFTGYTNYESEGIFDSHDVGGDKVLTFRYYKNGRFEIGFDSHLSTKQFAQEYLFCDTAGETAA